LPIYIRAKNDWWGASLLSENLVKTGPTPYKTPIFNRFSLVAPQPKHLAKKRKIITNRKSNTRFPMSLR